MLYFEHKRCYRAIKGEVPEGEYTVPLDRARVVREGTDIAVFSYGMMVHSSLEAVDRLAADGFSCEVVDLRSLRPFDRDAIVASASKCGKVLIVQEANLAVSVASEVAAIIAEECFDSLDAPVMRLGGPEIPAMPFSPPLEQFYLVTPDKVEASSASWPRTEFEHEEAREMALTVTMPQLGESVTEGTIARWLKQPGDAIAKYESIAEVITDKVNAEIPAPADGVMSELIAPEGTVVPVGPADLLHRHRRRCCRAAPAPAAAATRRKPLR